MCFRPFFIFIVAVVFLLSCSSQPTKQTQKAPQRVKPEVKIEQSSGEDYLLQAKQHYIQHNDAYQRNVLLLKAAAVFQSEQRCEKSIKVLQVLEPELQDNRQLTLAKLTLAECYLDIDNSELTFNRVETLLASMTFDYGYLPRIATVKSQLYVHQKEWLKAAVALQKSGTGDSKKSQLIWTWLNKLSLQELAQARLSQPNLQPWLQLSMIVKRYALQPELFNQQLVGWQSRHFGHELVNNLPKEIQQILKQEAIQARRVAVLLPLSGRLANQGLAIKEGILSAYLEDLSNAAIPPKAKPNSLLNNDDSRQFREVRFFDSALKSATELNALVADFDVVVGPLIKDKIAALRAILPQEKVLLALNRVTTDSNPAAEEVSLEPDDDSPAVDLAEHYFYSLAPEDEAEQLAKQLHSKQLIRPVVFAADNATTKRMAEAFIEKWQETNKGIQPELVLFTDSKEMRIGVAQILDVEQSNNRIQQIESLADVEVTGVERNRRDIDAIVLFADPEQTQLLNPIIEASLSSFAKKSLSVYASSRSHSMNLNSNSLRDLRNLTFTDMPWMLPNHNWQSLAQQTSQLWPQRQDTLLRLFAMGYDAYNLLPQLRRLKALPQVATTGLTGDISINHQGVLRRHLPLAQIAQDRVKLVAMD